MYDIIGLKKLVVNFLIRVYHYSFLWLLVPLIINLILFLAYHILAILENNLRSLIYFSIFHFLGWGILIVCSIIFNYYDVWEFRKELFEFKRRQIIQSRDSLLSDLDWLIEGIQEKKSQRDLFLDSRPVVMRSSGKYKDIGYQLFSFWRGFFERKSKSEEADNQMMEGVRSEYLDLVGELKNETNRIAEDSIKELEQKFNANE